MIKKQLGKLHPGVLPGSTHSVTGSTLVKLRLKSFQLILNSHSPVVMCFAQSKLASARSIFSDSETNELLLIRALMVLIVLVIGFSPFFQLVTGVWEGKYNFFCQGTRSAGEADMKVLSLFIILNLFFNKEIAQKTKRLITSLSRSSLLTF